MARKKAEIPTKSYAARIAAYPETMSGHERESLAAEATLAERRKPAKIKNKRKRREPSSHRFQYVPTTGRARDTS
jgi:hypothetical protein